jgi:phosphodiesterase/alkaline phosphatase D-like protein
MWAGGLTTTEATVAARLEGGSARVLATPAAGGETIASAAAAVPPSGVVQLHLVGLRPATAYDYTVEVDGRPDTGRGVGRLATFPEGPHSFSVAVASCARTGSSGAVYDAIRAADPDLFLVTGDLHYGNIAENSVSVFRNTLGRSLRAPAQAALYRSTPVAYIWDDHDYGPNDADASSPSRTAARAAYREDVPSYPLAAGDGDEAIYQAFSIGRVRFVLTDTRSERTGDTMLGERQLAWLERELVESSRTHALVVWVNPDPWIGPDDPGADSWAGHPEERRRIADAIAADGIVNVVMLGGDAHMVAIDDGSNSGYATGGGGGFPILQAAALDRPGNVKGGPYSEGALPGAGQFGLLRVDDDGAHIDVTLAAYDWQSRELLSYSFDVPPA